MRSVAILGVLVVLALVAAPAASAVKVVCVVHDYECYRHPPSCNDDECEIGVIVPIEAERQALGGA